MQTEFTRDELCEALRADMRRRMEQLPPEEELGHAFSPRFERMMNRLLREARRPRALNLALRAAKRAAIVVLAALLVSFNTVMSVSALREKLFEFIMQHYEEYTEVFGRRAGAGQAAAEFAPQAPAYIPDGFYLIAEDYHTVVQLDYQNDAGQTISYTQLPMGQGRIKINTEGVELEPVQINGWEGYYYSNIGYQSVVWHDELYIYDVTSELDKNEVIKIAKSTKSIFS